MVDHENLAADLLKTEDPANNALPQENAPLAEQPIVHNESHSEGHTEAHTDVEAPPAAAAPAPEDAPGTAEERDGHAHLEAAMPHSEESEAQVDERPDVERAALVAAGEQWGLVDEEGNVRVKEQDGSPGRAVGKMKGQNPASALGFFALKFQQITEKVEALEREMEGEAVKTRYLGRLNSMLQWIPRANALGDFEALVARVEGLRGAAQAQSEDNRQRKEDLCRRAEELSESTEWKNTAEAVKALQAEWKTVGPVVPREDDQALWTRFRAAGNRFFERRNEHFDRVEKEQKENRRRKEDLCQRAEALLTDATNFKTTAEAFKALQAEWKSIGPVLPRERNTALWERFRKANDQFFDRRQSHLEQLGRGQEENLRRKLELLREGRGPARLRGLARRRRRLQGPPGRVEDGRPGPQGAPRGGLGALPRRRRRLLRAPQGALRPGRQGAEGEPAAQAGPGGRGRAAQHLARLQGHHRGAQGPPGRVADHRARAPRQGRRPLGALPRRQRPLLRAPQRLLRAARSGALGGKRYRLTGFS